MTDTCRITKPGTGSRGAINPTTGQYDSTPATVTVYEGPCRLGRVDIPTGSAAAGGDASWNTQDSVLHLPLTEDTELVAVDNTVTYLTSAANPRLEGRSFGIVAIVEGTNLTALRCRVREVTG